MEEVKIDLDTIPTRAAIWIDIFYAYWHKKGCVYKLLYSVIRRNYAHLSHVCPFIIHC